MAEAEDGGGGGLSQEELTALFSGPAPLANKIYVSIAPHGLCRVSFVEFPSEGTSGPQFRSAATLSIADLLALRDLITQSIEQSGVKFSVVNPAQGGSDGSKP